MFITVFTKTRDWTMSCASRIQFFPSIPLFQRSILMLSSHLPLDLPRGSLHFGPPNQNPANTSSFSMRATCPAHLILLDLITLTYSVKNIVCEVHHYAIFSTISLLPFQVQISSSTLCSQKPSVYVPPSKCERTSFAPLQHNWQN
jgi:hypothetical protein